MASSFRLFPTGWTALLPAILFVGALLLAVAARAADAPPVTYRSDRVLVHLRPAVSDRMHAMGPGLSLHLAAPGLAAAAQAAGVLGWRPRFPRGTEAGSAGLGGFWLAQLAASVDPTEVVERLSALPEVVIAERIAIVPVTVVPNDSLWTQSTHLYQPSRADVHAPEAWDVTRGDLRIIVAIIDTGILTNHPDLAGSGPLDSDRVWKNKAEVDGFPGVDDDANGYIDDETGWDWIDLPDATGVFPGEDWENEDPDPNDFAGHGTAVAGMISAIPDNGIGTAGLGWNVRVMALRAGWAAQVLPLGLVDLSDAAAAIHYATRMGAHVINCSFSTDSQSDFAAAVDAAVAAGVLVVTASGNNNSPNSLAHRPDVLAVTATDANDAIPPFATRGPYVDLAAPGNALPTTFITRTGSDSIGLRQPHYTTGATGTSFASPLAAAAAALVQSHRLEQGQRLLSPNEMLLRLEEAADDISAANPGIAGYGAGRLNAARALTHLGSYSVRAGSPSVGPSVQLRTWSGGTRIAFAMRSGHLLIVSPEGDTLALTRLPGRPVSGITMGDGGDDTGPALFVVTEAGSLASFTAGGRPRAGWPVAVEPRADGILIGPAVADLDGDAAQEVVWGNPNGLIAVWRMDGQVVAGFPRQLTPAGPPSPIIALADVDGGPGAEIVATTPTWGRVYVLRHDAGDMPGWPRAAPFVTRSLAVGLGGVPLSPRIYVGGQDKLLILRANGGWHGDRTLQGFLTRDMGLADLDGDGVDEVILGLDERISVRDQNGALLAGWPQYASRPVAGPPIVGPIAPDGGAGVIVAGPPLQLGGEYRAFDAGGNVLPGFPKPGNASAWPGLVKQEGGDGTMVIAGAGGEGFLYFYEATHARWKEGAWWPTARGNFARTSSRIAVASPVFDDIPPDPVAGLSQVGTAAQVTLRWATSSDTGPRAVASQYRIVAAPYELNVGNIENAPIMWTVSAADDSVQEFTTSEFLPSSVYWITVIAVDAASNPSDPSAILRLDTPDFVPVPGLRLSLRQQPATTDVRLRWYSAGGPAAPLLRVYDVTGRLRRTLRPGPGFEGELVWDRCDGAGRRVAPGLYFATLSDGADRVTHRIVLVQ